MITYTGFDIYPDSTHRCDNCNLEYTGERMQPIENLLQRIEPGGVVPSGECPDCGALCYPIVEAAKKRSKGAEDFMRLTCLSCGEAVESQHRDFDRVLQETRFRPLFPEKGLKWLCARCGAAAEEHAAALLALLKGESVQVWQLVPEKRRLKLMGADESSSARTP